jgi:hypothetical protein
LILKRTAPTLTLIGLALLLAACQTPAPSLTYEGTTTIGGVAQPLTLTYQQNGQLLTGQYVVRAAAGSFDGTLTGDLITADLTPGPDCTYSFVGTLAATTLTGAFEPSACNGGDTGTWALERR